MGYTIQAIKGVSWMGAIRLVTRLLSLSKTLVIARILSPSQFGTFGIANLVLVFVEIVTETGVNTFLIQNKEDINKYIGTCWIVSMLRGLFIAILIIASAPFVSQFFRSPDSFNLLLLISLVPFLRGFINPSVVKFQKELEFNREFFYRSSSFLVETLFSIILVLIFRNVESLIYAMTAGVLYEIILSFVIVKPIPSFSFDFPLFRNVIGYGKWITANTIFNYFYQHGDDITVGRLLGTGPLGLYDMAYRISLVPISDVADVITKVTFPVYVKISDDVKRLQRAYLRTLLAVFSLVFPIGLIFFFFSREIVTLILGTKWIEAADVLKVLAIFGVVRAISVFSSSIFLSIGKQKIVTTVSFIGFLGLAVTVIPLVIIFGIVGAGISALIGATLTLPVIFYYWYKLLYKKIK